MSNTPTTKVPNTKPTDYKRDAINRIRQAIGSIISEHDGPFLPIKTQVIIEKEGVRIVHTFKETECFTYSQLDTK